MKVLFLSNLYPNAASPNRGIYNARLVSHLAKLAEVRVVSPRPTRGVPPFWSPKQFFARSEDVIFSPIFPPTAYLPKIGDRWNHILMARSLRETMGRIRREFPFDVALTSWIYPDACAVAELAREMGFRFVAVAQGSDVHQYLKISARRKIIVHSLANAEAVITRSRELARLLAEAGVPAGKLHTIYNGVESDIFHPGEKTQARAALNLPADETLLLYVGNLLAIKNPLLLVEAFIQLTTSNPHTKYRLFLLGDGPLQPEIERRLAAAGLTDRVSLTGAKPPAVVARFMQAADLLAVPSNNEGVPNVILEAFACGLPVVATRVGGIPEVLRENHLGRLCNPGEVEGLRKAIESVLSAPGQPERITTFAAAFTWENTARAYGRLLGLPDLPSDHRE